MSDNLSESRFEGNTPHPQSMPAPPLNSETGPTHWSASTQDVFRRGGPVCPPAAVALYGARVGGKQRISTRKKSRGQALVEFALVLPILLLLLFGTIDFGWIMFNYVSLYNVLREGIRY